MNRNWAKHIFIIKERKSDYGRVYVAKFFLPQDLKIETCNTIIENIMRVIKK